MMYEVQDGNCSVVMDTFEDLCQEVETWYDFLNETLENQDDFFAWDSVVEYEINEKTKVETIEDLQNYIDHIEEQIAEQDGHTNFQGHGNYYVSSASRMGLSLTVDMIDE